jgi:hypothetical protein
MSGEKSDMRALPPMRDRDSRISRTGNRRSDAWHDHERYSSRRQRLRLFPAAAKQKRIAALEPDHLFALPRFLDEQRVDFVLRERVRARLLSGENQLRAVRSPAQHLGVAEVIVNNHLSLLDAFLCSECHQPKVPWPGSD